MLTSPPLAQEEEEAAITLQRARNMLRRRVESVALRFGRATTDGVNLYGPITTVDLRQALADSELALKVKPAQLRMPGVEGEEGEEVTLTSAGSFIVQVEVQPDLWCDITVNVVST